MLLFVIKVWHWTDKNSLQSDKLPWILFSQLNFLF